MYVTEWHFRLRLCAFTAACAHTAVWLAQVYIYIYRRIHIYIHRHAHPTPQSGSPRYLFIDASKYRLHCLGRIPRPCHLGYLSRRYLVQADFAFDSAIPGMFDGDVLDAQAKLPLINN